jgi:uncharacterized protein (DUF1810 family)
MPSRLARFRNAQDSPDDGFESALKEIQSGHKLGHWIWYVFPQIAGLGSSSASQRYGIDGEQEAVAFLRDSELRSRLVTIAQAVAEQLRSGVALSTLMGSDIDARKVVSSLTLFGHVARKLERADGLEEYRSLVRVADEVLAVAAAQGYPPCAYTLRQLTAWR